MLGMTSPQMRHSNLLENQSVHTNKEDLKLKSQDIDDISSPELQMPKQKMSKLNLAIQAHRDIYDSDTRSLKHDMEERKSNLTPRDLSVIGNRTVHNQDRSLGGASQFMDDPDEREKTVTIEGTLRKREKS
mmetsp:Transcript_38835/g.59033  ORF Transcript_38835/g.59033 Transcript_38835/m.59033 type:complete len:131 (-) Transcript_38835:374-766(-)